MEEPTKANPTGGPIERGNPMNQFLKFILGFLLVALGLGLVIKDWAVLAAMIKAFAGVIIALIGMVMMFSSGIRRR